MSSIGEPSLPRASAATGAAGRGERAADDVSSAALACVLSLAAAFIRAAAFSSAFAAHRMDRVTMR